MNIVFDETNAGILILSVIFFLVMNVMSIVRKNAWFSMASFLCSIAMVVVHVLLRNYLTEAVLHFNVYVDLAFMAVSVTVLFIVDEIETRRSIIGHVFEKRYGKK